MTDEMRNNENDVQNKATDSNVKNEEVNKEAVENMNEEAERTCAGGCSNSDEKVEVKAGGATAGSVDEVKADGAAAGSADEVKAEGAKADGSDAAEEVLPELEDIDVDWEAEKICRWGAARAGAIVVAPLMGTMALIANEVYMITRLADLRGVELSDAAALGLLSSLGATFVGQSVATLIPIAAIQVPLGISVTYGVGKAANAWLKAGRPEDIASFRVVYEKARKEGMSNTDAFKNMDCKDEPLGDESKKFDLDDIKEKVKNFDANDFYQKIKGKADNAESSLSEKIRSINEKFIAPVKFRGSRWISAQNWQQLSKGELVIPYGELKDFLGEALEGSEFTLEDLFFRAPDYLCIDVKHETYGIIKLSLTILDFYVDEIEAVAHIKVEGFDIADNDFASLIISTVGDKLIIGVLSLVFDQVSIEMKNIKTRFEDGVISIDFSKAIQESPLGTKKLLDRSLLDVLHLVSMETVEEGIRIKASIML